MIIDFTFSGLGPFKEPVTLTFEASKDTHLGDAYVRDIELDNKKKIRLLRLAMLYGANAAGKTTVLDALSLLDSLVTSPATDSEEEIDANFFAFNKTAEEQTAELTVKFVRAGKVYRYQLRVTKNSILYETLEYQATPPDGKKFVLIYGRSRGEAPNQFSFKYGPKQKLNEAEEEKLRAELLPNTTMLSVMSRKMTIRNPMIQEAYLWFKEQLLAEVTPKTDLTDWVTSQLASGKINQNRLIQSLNQAGVPIANLNVVDQRISANKVKALNGILSDEARKKFMDSISRQKEVHTVYKIDGNEYHLELGSQESWGTQRYYGLAGMLNVLCPESSDAPHCKILPIDEIEHSLHPDLLEHFLVTFLNDSGNSQLIATTHYRELLQNNLLFRDDVIWFVDKDEASLSSVLYCLHDVKKNAGLRGTSSVYNFYKHGRLGAVPKLKA